MTNQKMACPNRIELLSLIDESLADETVELHVSTCKLCQAELDRLSDSDNLAGYRDVVSRQADVSRYFGPPANAGDLGSLDELAIERQIGAGGMGDVFQARDLALGRPVAVKVLSRARSHESDARFVREAKSVAKLRHDNVVSIFSTGRTADGTPYLVMPLIEGVSLKERLARDSTDIRQAASWIHQIALGLQSAHDLGMIHRDVKPANILLDAKDGRAKLTDFGMARSSGDETLTQADVVAGTPQYMSPEQASSAVGLGPATDVYSLGITLYECLTGTTPFQGQPLQILEQHRATHPLNPSSLNPNVPQNLDTVCMKAIAKSPSRRYLTAAEFADDLQRFLDDRPVLARETTNLEKLRMWCGRNRKVAALGSLSILLLLTVLTVSSISAWRLNSANQRIIDEKEKATTAERLAISDRNAVIDALETVVDSIYEELSNNAASIRTREEVVTAAIEALGAITSVEGDLKYDRTSFRAFMRIGDLCFLKGDQSLAETNYDNAITIARGLADSQPDDLLAKRELAIVLSRLSGHYLRLGNQKFEQPCDEATRLLIEVLAENPDDTNAMVQLVVQHEQQLKRIRMFSPNEPQKVIDFGESILDDVRRVFEMKTDSRLAWETAHTIHFCIGRGYLESEKAEQAEEHFTEAQIYLSEALVKAPANVELQSASAVLDRAQAMACQSLGKLAEAIKLYESALETLLRLATADADNLAQHQHVANTQVIMSLAYSLAGRTDDAIEVLTSAAKIYQRMIDKNSGNDMARALKIQTEFQMAAILFGEHRLVECQAACESIRGEVRRAEFAPAFQAGVKYYLDCSAILMEATAWLSDRRPVTATSSGKCMALLLAAKRDMKTALNSSLSSQTIDMVNDIEVELNGPDLADLVDFVNARQDLHPFVSDQRKFSEAVLFGSLAENVADAHGIEAQDEVALLVERSVSALGEFARITHAGKLKGIILNDHYLDWVRNTSEFKQAWIDIVESTQIP